MEQTPTKSETNQNADGQKEVRQLSTIEQSIIHNNAVDAIKTCYDPEIPVNIYELGLVYDVKVAADGGVLVVMTLTSPYCPAAQSLPLEVEAKIKAMPNVTQVVVKIVLDPQWNPSMMTEAAKLELGM